MPFEKIPLDLIEQQVSELMAVSGIVPRGTLNLVFDTERPQRFAVEGDRGTEKSGWYLLHSDGCPAGDIGDWHGEKIHFVFDFSRLGAEYENIRKQSQTSAFKAEAIRIQAERDKRLKASQAKAAEEAQVYFTDAKKAPANHPYLERKKIYVPELKIDGGGNLLLPFYDARGRLQCVQRIPAEKGVNKKYWQGCTPTGAWFTLGADITEGPILVSEGIATGATIFQCMEARYLTTVVGNCHNLLPVCKELRRKYPGRQIIVMRDDDAGPDKNGNPKKNAGAEAATACMREKAADWICPPPFDRKRDGYDLSDWNDYCGKYGEGKTTQQLSQGIAWACMSREEREGAKLAHTFDRLRHTIDKSSRLPKEDFIGGIFPRGKLSTVVAAPGTGKTWFLQKFISDISIGGAVFDGVSDAEGEKVSLTFAGEAGSETLDRRARLTDWPFNGRNVHVYDMIECLENGLSLALDEDDGKRNVEILIKKHKPDIVFFDTLSSFHSLDENKAADMKPVFMFLIKMARVYNIAVVLMHHTRKRKLAEQKMQMTQDEVIGSSIFNRLVSLIVGIEAIRDNNGEDMGNDVENLVKVQKTWFRRFSPFTFKITEDDDERTIMEINLDPQIGGGVKSILWDYIERTYEPGRWFKAGELKGVVSVSRKHIHHCLSELVKSGKLQQRGSTRNSEYALVGFYRGSTYSQSDEIEIPF